MSEAKSNIHLVIQQLGASSQSLSPDELLELCQQAIVDSERMHRPGDKERLPMANPNAGIVSTLNDLVDHLHSGNREEALKSAWSAYEAMV
jgi:hypothetical protein